jgi:hypothetical protein
VQCRTSNEFGRFEVYIIPFGSAGGGNGRFSMPVAASQVWRRDGREIFYLLLEIRHLPESRSRRVIGWALGRSLDDQLTGAAGEQRSGKPVTTARDGTRKRTQPR